MSIARAERRRTHKAYKKSVDTAQPDISYKLLIGNFNEFTKHVQDICTKFFDKITQSLKSVDVALNQLWNNQQIMVSGLKGAEDHIMLIRRVLNDALKGVTRIRKIERKVEVGKEDKEQVDVIDWGWYTTQLDFSDNKSEFMAGTIVPEEVIQAKIEARTKHEDEVFERDLAQIEEQLADTIKRRADDLYALITDEKGFRAKVKLMLVSLINDLSLSIRPTKRLLDAVCTIMKNELLARKKAISLRGNKMNETVIIDEVADVAEDQYVEVKDVVNPEADGASSYPEDATIFGGE